MNKGAALHNFFSHLLHKPIIVTTEEDGEIFTRVEDSEEYIPAYAASSVPDDVVFPYLTYELATSSWGGGEIGLTVNLWFYTTSEAIPNAKAQEFSEAIGLGGKILPCDGGAIWLKRGSPWCQSLKDETSLTIKRRYINVTAEYLTLD